MKALGYKRYIWVNSGRLAWGFWDVGSTFRKKPAESVGLQCSIPHSGDCCSNISTSFLKLDNLFGGNSDISSAYKYYVLTDQLKIPRTLMLAMSFIIHRAQETIGQLFQLVQLTRDPTCLFPECWYHATAGPVCLASYIVRHSLSHRQDH